MKFDPTSFVREFITAFDAPTTPEFWLTLVKEETKELQDAIITNDRENGLKELSDVMYVVAGLLIAINGMPEDGPDLSWEFVAQIKITEGFARFALHHFGFDKDMVHEAFRRVHASNMSKLGDDGKPIRREDGKILKGPNYKAPDLSDLV